MEAEASASGQRPPKRPRQRRGSTEGMTFESSVANLSIKGRETLMIVNRHGRLNTTSHRSCTVFDNTCPHYNWLHSGWIAEERILKPHNRMYRYYYDPLGQRYGTRGEVEVLYGDIEKSREVIVIDEPSFSMVEEHVNSLLIGEGLAILAAVQRAHKMCYSKLQLFSNSKVYVDVINASSGRREIYSIVRDICSLARIFKVISFTSIIRSLNSDADSTAKTVLSEFVLTKEFNPL